MWHRLWDQPQVSREDGSIAGGLADSDKHDEWNKTHAGCAGDDRQGVANYRNQANRRDQRP